LPPVVTGSGESESVSDRSACAVVAVVAAAELLEAFESADVPETDAVAAIEPVAPGLAFTTNEKSCGELTARLGPVHVIVPVPPTSGVVHDQPPGALADTKVVCAGTGSVSVAPTASSGPEFATVTA
jgi:hypothetical protein